MAAHGIDVSHWQGTISWDDEAKVREHLAAIMAHVAGIQALLGEAKK